MAYFDRHTAATLFGRAVIIAILIFMSLVVVAWWYSVLRFFFYDHWRPTAWCGAVALAWYVIGRAIEDWVKKTRSLQQQRLRRDYGNDDCA